MITDDNDVIGKAIARVRKQCESIEQNIGATSVKEIKRKEETKVKEPKKRQYVAVLKIASIVVIFALLSIIYSFIFIPNSIRNLPTILKNIDPIAIIKGGRPDDKSDFTHFKIE